MKKLQKLQKNKGMTYVEIIVVLSIFSVMTSVVLFNYTDFQSKVDIKNLASDIALKVVEAQKSSLSGKLPTQIPTITPWRPSYGVYFFNPVADNKNFIYFTDLNDDSLYLDGSTCAGECVSKISITKNNIISRLDVFFQDGTSSASSSNGLDSLSVTFLRPNSGAIINFTGFAGSIVSYAQITVGSSQSSITNAKIKIYPSGRIQVN